MDVQEPEYPQPTPATTRSQQAARIALAIALVGLAAYTLQSYVSALAWAGIFAIATWPLYQRVQWRWPPGRHNLLVPSLFTAAIALLFVVPLILLALRVGREWHGVAKWVLEARTTGLPVPEWIGQLPIGRQQATEWWQANLANPNGLSELLGRLDRAQVVTVSQRIGSLVVRRTVLFGFTLLTLFFLFRDGRTLAEQMLTASVRALGPGGERIGRQIVASVRGTVNGLVLVGIGEGALLGIAYAIVGVPQPALIGAVTAVAAMIPFGAALVFGFAALLLVGKGATAAAIVLFGFGLLVVFVADHAVRPVLIGGATRLPFLWVLLGILGGVEAWGLLGLFLGPAIMAALMLLWREWTERAADPALVKH